MTFREQFLLDTQDLRAWFDPETFGRVLDIDGHKILGILVSHVEDKQYTGTEGYSVSMSRLYVRASDVKGVTAGQSVTVDGTVYTVRSYDLLGGALWRVLLEGAG